MQVEDIHRALPSTAPSLDAESILRVRFPVLHLNPIDPSRVDHHQHSGVARVNHQGTPDRSVALALWDGESFDYCQVDDEFESVRELLETHDVRYVRARRLSCAATIAQVLDQSKTVTRRLSRGGMRVGEFLNLADGSRRPGVRVIGMVRVVSIRQERLTDVTMSDVEAEGFPGLYTAEFCAEFRRINGLGTKDDPAVHRIEFEYL